MHLSHAVVYVDDGTVPVVLEFYERAFGLTRRFYDPTYQYAELDSGPATVAIAAHAAAVFMMPGAYTAPAPGTRVVNTELAFTLADVQSAFDRAVEAGAEVITAPYAVPWGQTVAYVRSVEGTIIGLCTPVPATAPASDSSLVSDKAS
ncbi:MAG: Glyoxalase/bleomycin resistance protein/dioxygenase [Geminicoccaceae bacterium]|nr:Glyoxalase/bleomycin resistance protein/dioxygenase [Geminicoccaceae bacterium]